MAQVELWSKWEFEDAVKKLVEGVEQYPAFVELQNTLAVAYIIIGETEKAMTHANICLALDPKNHVHYYNKARVHFAMGEFRKAIEKMPKQDAQPRYERLSGSYYDVDPEVLEKQIRNNKNKGNHSPAPKLNNRK